MMMNRSRLILQLALSLFLVATTSCAQASPKGDSRPAQNKEIVKLPTVSGLDEANLDYFQLNDKDMVLALTADGTLYQMQYGAFPDNYRNIRTTPLKKEILPEKLKAFFSAVSPDKRTVYLKADAGTHFSDVADLFAWIRKADGDRVSLIAVGEDPAAERNAAGFEVKLPAAPEPGDMSVKPNPLTLVATMSAGGELSLNGEKNGTISDPAALENRLRQIFSEREKRGVFREGTNDIEKTLYLRVSKSLRYEDLLKLVYVVDKAGATPVGIQIDDLEDIK